MLEWFNENCPFVQRHYKSGDISDTASKYSADGVVWLAINSTHDNTNAQNLAWVKENGMLVQDDWTTPLVEYVARTYWTVTVSPALAAGPVPLMRSAV